MPDTRARTSVSRAPTVWPVYSSSTGWALLETVMTDTSGKGMPPGPAAPVALPALPQAVRVRVVASGDNEMSAEHDRINRETFEEAMEVIKLAWGNERFSFDGTAWTVRLHPVLGKNGVSFRNEFRFVGADGRVLRPLKLPANRGR